MLQVEHSVLDFEQQKLYFKKYSLQKSNRLIVEVKITFVEKNHRGGEEF